jgi:hypothetical protein
LLAATAAATPFEPTDWTPELPPSRIKPVDLVQNLLLTLYPTTLAPFINEEWPTPRYTVSRAIESAAVNQNLYLPLGRPFVTNNWPAIPRRTSPVTEAAQNLLLTALAAAPATAPFEPTDWSVPARPVLRQSEAVQNLLLTLLPTTLAPFVPEEWAVSTQRPTRSTEAFPNLLLTTLAQTSAAPFVSYDWTVLPVRTTKPQEVAPNIALTLLPTTARPFVSYDWTPPPRDRAPHIAVIEQNNQSLANIPPTPNLGRLFYDVDEGHWYLRLNATTHEIIRIT